MSMKKRCFAGISDVVFAHGISHVLEDAVDTTSVVDVVWSVLIARISVAKVCRSPIVQLNDYRHRDFPFAGKSLSTKECTVTSMGAVGSCASRCACRVRTLGILVAVDGDSSFGGDSGFNCRLRLWNFSERRGRLPHTGE